MKKIIAIILTFILCLGLAACGGASDGEFNSETNQKVEYEGISLEVPQNWEKEKSQNDNSYLYGTKYYGMGFFSTHIDDSTDLEQSILGFENTIKIQENLLGNIEKTQITVANEDAARLKYVIQNKDFAYTITDVLFISKETLFIISFTSDKDNIGAKDFEKIINSIKL